MAVAAVAGAAVAGGIIDKNKFGTDIVTKILDGLTEARIVAIGIDNETGTKWTAKGTFLDFSTTSDIVLPETVETGKALLYSARRVAHLPAMGIAGVLTYDTGNGNTLAIMFYVPFDYIFHSNRWNVHVFEGEVEASGDLYDKLYSSRAKPFKGDDSWHDKDDIGEGYKARGVMTSSSKATLVVRVEKQ